MTKLSFCRRKLKVDVIRKKEVMKAENLATNSPLINGRTDAVAEEKGVTYMDSPGMRPTARVDGSDMRKMAILRNAAARNTLKIDADGKPGPNSQPGSPGQKGPGSPLLRSSSPFEIPWGFC